MAYLKYYLYKKQISRDDGQTWSDVDPTELSPSGNPIGTYDTLGECESATPPEPPTPENDYFTIIAKSDGYAGMSCSRSSATLSYSLNDGAWSSYSNSFSIPVSVGDKIRVKSTSKPFSKDNLFFEVNGSQDEEYKFELYGNIMSLGYGDNFTGITSMTGMFNAYSLLCYDNNNVVNAENLVLPATTLTLECYDRMFFNCTSLTTAPELPATTLKTRCYRAMFAGCTSLTTAPSTLPATTLADGCYQSMFGDCVSLTTAPVLSATTMASGCCQYMFDGCSNLSNITCLATNISASSCTENWVRGVAANGTFTKASSMSSWTTGNNGIPSGWTIQNA